MFQAGHDRSRLLGEHIIIVSDTSLLCNLNESGSATRFDRWRAVQNLFLPQFFLSFSLIFLTDRQNKNCRPSLTDMYLQSPIVEVSKFSASIKPMIMADLTRATARLKFIFDYASISIERQFDLYQLAMLANPVARHLRSMLDEYLVSLSKCFLVTEAVQLAYFKRKFMTAIFYRPAVLRNSNKNTQLFIPLPQLNICIWVRGFRNARSVLTMQSDPKQNNAQNTIPESLESLNQIIISWLPWNSLFHRQMSIRNCMNICSSLMQGPDMNLIFCVDCKPNIIQSLISQFELELTATVTASALIDSAVRLAQPLQHLFIWPPVKTAATVNHLLVNFQLKDNRRTLFYFHRKANAVIDQEKIILLAQKQKQKDVRIYFLRNCFWIDYAGDFEIGF